MPHAFEVTERDITQLDPAGLRLLVNRLLDVSARRAGGATVHASDRNDVADGGIDVWVRGFIGHHRHIPEGDSVWQVKAGKTPRSGALGGEITKERKPGQETRVRDAIIDGASYVAVLGDSPTPGVANRRANEVAAAADGLRLGGAGTVLCAEAIAQWANDHPELLYFFDRQFPNVHPIERVAAETAHAAPFQIDLARESALESLKAFLVDPAPTSAHFRIEGLAGVGKTRFAIEATRGVAGVLYAMEYPSELVNWVQSSNDRHCILVLDDLDDRAKFRRAEEEAKLAQGRIRLITIGHNPVGGEGSAIVAVAPVDDETMAKAIRATAPSLDGRQVDYVVHFAGGFIRLGREVAIAVAEDKIQNAADITRLNSVRAVLDRLFSDEERRALEALSVARRVGWDGDVEVEGQSLCESFGLNWQTVRRTVSRLEGRGLVSRQGRYRYVTPEILAVRLASQWWEECAADYERLYEALASDGLKQAFVARIGTLSGTKEVQGVAEAFFGVSGPLHTLDDLNTESAGTLVRTLGRVAPETALGGLERLFTDASTEALLALDSGRRQVVWLLEELSAPRATFTRAQRLLAMLALAENENIGNNATGVWASRFLAFLSQTAAPAAERVPLLVELIEDYGSPGKVLALKGIKAALTHTEYGLGYGVGGDKNMPPPSWKPDTWDELRDYRREALALLDPLLQDADDAVRHDAITVLVECAHGMANEELGTEIVERLRSAPWSNQQERTHVWEAIHHVLELAKTAGDTDLEQLAFAASDAIFGSSFSDRLRRTVGSFSWVDWEDDHGVQAATRRAEGLAREVLSGDASLAPEDLAWLASGQAEQAYAFAHELGLGDADGTFESDVIGATSAGSDLRFASGYLNGRAAAGAPDNVEAVLDSLAEDPDSAPLAFMATANGEPSELRLGRMLRLVETGVVEPPHLQSLLWGKWSDFVDPESLLRAMELLLALPRGAGVVLALELFTHCRAALNLGAQPPLLAIAWQVLETDVEQPSGMYGYEWKLLAARLLEIDAPRVVRAIVDHELGEERFLNEEHVQVLLTAARDYPGDTWKVLSDALLDNPSLKWRLGWRVQETAFMDELDVDTVMSWVRTDPETRGLLVASLVKPHDELSELARQLIILCGAGSHAAATLRNNFESGTWSGSHADREERQVHIARGWLDDRTAEVRLWASEVIRSIESHIPALRLDEEERDW